MKVGLAPSLNRNLIETIKNPGASKLKALEISEAVGKSAMNGSPFSHPQQTIIQWLKPPKLSAPPMFANLNPPQTQTP
ncbi:hypothetical protein [Sphingomonas sp. R1]|uniref:hypothetical protein n=1 Tax=Sphingomonas sp. R1 TaxID=399176 RepID=UPI00222544F9|nr:hypothetical protein [Sphingomonas sp. R1]UYY79354.1 hypothetical protein OIM94_10035 [Sphingomonas sp. R1]